MTARLQDIEVVLADRPGSLAAFGETPRTGRGQPGGRRCFYHRLTGGGPLPRRRRCACTPGVGSRRDRTSDDPRRHHAATTPGSSRATWPPRRPDGRGRGQHRRPVQRPRSPPRARGISRAHHRCPEGRRHLECPTANESVRCLGPASQRRATQVRHRRTKLLRRADDFDQSRDVYRSSSPHDDHWLPGRA